jgi:primosomal protein N' (replication factor Y) (superfamily II helicase)
MLESGPLSVAVETPRHSAVGGLLDYQSEQPLVPGTLVRVPLGKRETTGIVWDRPADTAPPEVALRSIGSALVAMPPLSVAWRALINFAANYYQRGVGELALAVLPPELRKLDNNQLARRVSRLQSTPATALAAAGQDKADTPPLTPEQADAVTAVLQALQATPALPGDTPKPHKPLLLHRQWQDRGLSAGRRRRPATRFASAGVGA